MGHWGHSRSLGPLELGLLRRKKTFLVPLTETERIPGTQALPLFPSVRTEPGAPCPEGGRRAVPPPLRAPTLALLHRLPWDGSGGQREALGSICPRSF